MVMQTVVLPSFSLFSDRFDLLIIAALYLSLIATHHSMIIALVMIGCVMDSMSGVPFFFHIFSYILIYLIVHLVKRLIFKQSIIFLIIISLMAVLIQHILLFFSVFVRQEAGALLGFDFFLPAKQAFWGLIIIPPCITLLHGYRRNWLGMTRRMKKQMADTYRG
jgi:rod shape-determining protein MreD